MNNTAKAKTHHAMLDQTRKRWADGAWPLPIVLRPCGEKVNDYLHPQAELPNYLLKKFEHRHQREVRFAWRFPETRAEEFRLVGVKESSKFCRIRTPKESSP